MYLRFEHPYILFLILFSVFAFIVFKINLRKYFIGTVVHFCRNGKERNLFLLKKNITAVFFLMAWCFAVIGTAGPLSGNKTGLIRKSGSEIIFVFDVSRSMLVSDILPSRLTAASFCAKNILDGLGGIPCGAVLVKGSAVLSVPLTTDYTSLYSLISSLSPGLVTSPGSGLADGLSTAFSSFSKDRDNASFVILFSDGDETAGDLTKAAFKLREKNIALIVVGTGTEEGKEINIYANGEKTEMKLTALNENLLQSAVVSAGGKSSYFRITDAAVATQIISVVSPDDSGTILVSGSKPVSRRPEFFALALFCFIGGISAGVYWRKS